MENMEREKQDNREIWRENVTGRLREMYGHMIHTHTRKERERERERESEEG